MAEVDQEFVRRLAEQADQLAEDRVERNARIHELEARVAELHTALRGAEWCLHRASTIYVRDRDLPGYNERWQAVEDALKGKELK